MNRTIPLVLAVALFMEQMDSTVIATSLPAIAADIDTNPIALKLALTAYLVSVAIFIPISAWMADRFGAKRVFCTAIGVFVLGSIACATASSLGGFVLARFLQGMGGSMMTPVARLLLVRATPRSNLVSAMAWLTVPALVGPLVGPPVGGFITTFVSWHWIFLINVPIGVAGICAAWLLLPELERGIAGRIDFAGFALSGMAAAGIVFGLSVVSLPALPPVFGFATLALGICSGLLYFRHARRVERPILDLGLFRNPVFRAAISGGSLFRIGAGATPFLLPLMFQLGFGLSPFQSGMLTFAGAFGAIGMKFFASTTLRKGGFRTVLISTAIAGGIFIGVAAAFTAETPAWMIIAVLIVGGFLRSLFFTSANALVFADIGDDKAGQATAIAAVTQQISIALGVALAGGILEGVAMFSGDTLGATAFAIAFVLVGLVTSLAALPFLALPPDAGSTVSGHRSGGVNSRSQVVPAK
ncbi:MFS transporter [Aquibium sp. LZ166]|uniref:MFS transporter n=1 Tax=Aquibium pacificus TaxID=3153579 RepID=A0ABV3SFQ3_9HYPH